MKMPFDFRGKSLGNRRKNSTIESDWDMLEDDYWEGFEELEEDAEESQSVKNIDEADYEEALEGAEHFEEVEYEASARNNEYETPDLADEESTHEEDIEEAYEPEETYEAEEYIVEDAAAIYAEENFAEEAEESEEGCYEGEESGAVYYEDEEESAEDYYENEASEAAYYEDEEQEIYYEDESYEADDDEYKQRSGRKAKAAPLSRVTDYLVMVGGAAVILVALVLGGTYLASNGLKQTDNEVQEVGSQLSDITMIGEQGLLAMSDAQKALLNAVETPEETETAGSSEYDEEDYLVDVNVKLSLTSIEKDLKIKFLNSDTGKLVGNVPFAVEITDADGKTIFWSDDDMDGIIYKKNLTPGMYTVKVQELVDEKYKSYGLPENEKKVEVKAEIVYEKVDVTAEIKTEAQVDVQKEDTKKNETIIEEYLKDTVAWVESTVSDEAYEEVTKGNIPDPLTLAMKGNFTRLSAVVGPEAPASPVPPSITEAPATEVPATEAPATEVPATEVPATEVPATEVPATEVPATEIPATVPPATEVPATEAPATEVPATEVPATQTPAVTQTPQPSETPEPTKTPEPTATPAPMVIVPDSKTATVYVDTPYELKYKIENKMEGAVVKAEAAFSNIVKVEVKDDKLVLTGLTAGSVTVTITCETEDYEAQPVVCSIVVKTNPKADKTNVLKDNQGREMYVLENGDYRPAYYADYYTADKFYARKEAKYTGWQTVDGSLRYYNAAGQYVTGEQVIQGVKYNFSSNGSLVTGTGSMGIDVSKWNGTIDWNAVKNSGVSYVIIRCGYRGSSQGALIEDSKFEENIKGATKAGLKVGVYFFTQAVDKSEALEEASMVLELVKNYNISYPIFLDVEPSGGRADSLDKATRTEICKTFCEMIKQYGYTPGIYANKTWLEGKLDMSVLNSYKIWLAQYASEPTYQGRYDMWQYKATGKVSGVNGDVDLNMSYLGY